MITAFQANAKDRQEYNRAYHRWRWENDPAYREHKRTLARKTQAEPDYNEKRRKAREKRTPEQIELDAARAAEWAASRPARIKAYHLKRLYNLTLDDVMGMLERQGGCCAICGILFSPRKPHKIDHCHATGAVRGLLCNTCNTALGKFQDSPPLLRKAAMYLEKAREN